MKNTCCLPQHIKLQQAPFWQPIIVIFITFDEEMGANIGQSTIESEHKQILILPQIYVEQWYEATKTLKIKNQMS